MAKEKGTSVSIIVTLIIIGLVVAFCVCGALGVFKSKENANSDADTTKLIKDAVVSLDADMQTLKANGNVKTNGSQSISAQAVAGNSSSLSSLGLPYDVYGSSSDDEQVDWAVNVYETWGKSIVNVVNKDYSYSENNLYVQNVQREELNLTYKLVIKYNNKQNKISCSLYGTQSSKSGSDGGAYLTMEIGLNENDWSSFKMKFYQEIGSTTNEYNGEAEYFELIKSNNSSYIFSTINYLTFRGGNYNGSLWTIKSCEYNMGKFLFDEDNLTSGQCTTLKTNYYDNLLKKLKQNVPTEITKANNEIKIDLFKSTN